MTYSNGDVKNLGKVTGENGANGSDGADGLGIKSLTLSPSGELVVTMTDNSITNLGNIKGEKGDKGDQGLQGEKGADGRGIAKTEFVNGELVITYTDGTSDNLGSVSGTGEKEYLIYRAVMKDDNIVGYSAALNPLYCDEVHTIEIPAQHNGLPVIALGFRINTWYVSTGSVGVSNHSSSSTTLYGFTSSTLEEVIIPESVTKIYNPYFWNCYNLKRVIFKDPTGWEIGTDSASPTVKDIPEEDMKSPEKCKDIIKAYNTFQYVLYKDL